MQQKFALVLLMFVWGLSAWAASTTPPEFNTDSANVPEQFKDYPILTSAQIQAIFAESDAAHGADIILDRVMFDQNQLLFVLLNMDSQVDTLHLSNCVIVDGISFDAVPHAKFSDKIDLFPEERSDRINQIIQEKIPKALTEFDHGLVINNCHIFSKKEGFINRTQNAIAAEDVRFNYPITIKDSTFHGDFLLHDVIVADSFFLQGNTFMGKVDFNRLYGTWIELIRNTYQGSVAINSSLIKNFTILNSAFDTDVSIINSFFSESRIRDNQFNQFTSFNSSRYLNFLDISGSSFQNFLDFRGCLVERLIYNNKNRPVQNKASIDFRGCRFGELFINDVSFIEQVDFSEAEFGRKVWTPEFLKGFKLIPADPMSNMSSKHPDSDESDAPDAVLKNDLSASVFQTHFVAIRFAAEVLFLRSRFYQNVAFEQVNAGKRVDFQQAVFESAKTSHDHPPLVFSYFRFRELQLSWSQVSNKDQWISDEHQAWRELHQMQPVSTVFGELSTNFRNIGEIAAADAVTFYQKEAEFGQEWKKFKDSGWDYVSTQYSKALSTFFTFAFHGIPSGYGTQLGRFVLFILGFNLIFCIVYFKMGTLYELSEASNTTFSMNFFNLPSQHILKDTGSDYRKVRDRIENTNQQFQRIDSLFPSIFLFWNYYRFGLQLTFKYSSRQLFLYDEHNKGIFIWIMRIQWLFGYWLLLLLVEVVSKKIPAGSFLVGTLGGA